VVDQGEEEGGVVIEGGDGRCGGGGRGGDDGTVGEASVGVHVRDGGEVGVLDAEGLEDVLI